MIAKTYNLTIGTSTIPVTDEQLKDLYKDIVEHNGDLVDEYLDEKQAERVAEKKAKLDQPVTVGQMENISTTISDGFRALSNRITKIEDINTVSAETDDCPKPFPGCCDKYPQVIAHGGGGGVFTTTNLNPTTPCADIESCPNPHPGCCDKYPLPKKNTFIPSFLSK